MSVTLQILDVDVPEELDPKSPVSVRSAARRLAAEEYGDALRAAPKVDDGSLYPLLNRFRERLVEIDQQYEVDICFYL